MKLHIARVMKFGLMQHLKNEKFARSRGKPVKIKSLKNAARTYHSISDEEIKEGIIEMIRRGICVMDENGDLVF